VVDTLGKKERECVQEKQFMSVCNRVRIRDEKERVIGLGVQDRLTCPTRGIHFTY